MNNTGCTFIVSWFFEAINNRDLDGLDGLVAPKFVWHGNNDQGIRAYKKDLKGIYDAFPNASWVIDDLLSDGDKGCVRWTFRGVHKGPWGTFPATGKRVIYGGITICRIAGGLLVEVWNIENLYSFYQQIGAKLVPPP